MGRGAFVCCAWCACRSSLVTASGPRCAAAAASPRCASRTIFTASSARGLALCAMLGAPPAAETGPHPRLAPHEFKLFLGLSSDYQILYFRPQLRDGTVELDKTV
ncbi:hypothetical protein M885DRAFT_534799 [Pelagophyceae sp. CCMP2097]|nr:hypothetical protein M885DRAFT_534799 [Pelagophyceae sp. CCMP2097]